MSDDKVRDCLAGLSKTIAPDGHFLLLEAVWPSHRWNLFGWLVCWMDRGRFVRTRRQWLELLGESWELADPRIIRHGLLEYFICTMKLRMPHAVTSAQTFRSRSNK